MLSISTVEQHEAIVEAIQWWHRKGALPAPAPAGMTLADNQELTIDYGYDGDTNGQIVLRRGQFEVIAASTSQGRIAGLQKYQHKGKSRSLQNYIDALKSSDLASNPHLVSRMIILTSECARSAFVMSAIQKLIESQQTLPEDAWAGMKFGFNHYRQTAEYAELNINAGQSPWTALRRSDYENYIAGKKFTGNRVAALGEVSKLQAYISK